jgi:hypothetical protein
MAFRDNSVLISTANKINLIADGSDGTVYNGTAGADAFVVADGAVGDDQIIGFSSNDSIITGKKIFDGNGDGYIAFGDNQTLDVDRFGGGASRAGADNITVLGTGADLISIIRYLGTKDGGFVYADAGTRDSLLGHFASGFQSTAAAADSSITQSLKIDNDVADNTFDFGATSVALLTDNALGMNFGSDTINGFGSDDLLVFTSAIHNLNNTGPQGDAPTHVTFGKNLVLDLSGANGPLATDPTTGPGGQIDLNTPDQVAIKYLGEKLVDGTTYYYYGSVGTALTPDGVSI